jgi:prolyl-tRNA editing enzyme YbaK/EbsC (Cys-tRNA(Pro) deacylase)
VSEIAKSVVFFGSRTVVVVLTGDRRVDIEKLRRLVGGNAKPGTANEVAMSTGYVIGGVPPFPHYPNVKVLLDRSILDHEMVWAAAGAPNAVLRIRSDDLVRLVGGDACDLSG